MISTRQTNRRIKPALAIASVLVVLGAFLLLDSIKSTRQVQARISTSLGAAPAPMAQVYELPLRGDDLNVGERFMTFIHKPGIQAEGKDINARRHVSDDNWSSLKTDGADNKVLTNYVDYGKPFYAMAPGTVIACWRNAPENTPGSLHKDIDSIPGGGNHFWIRQDDGVTVLYAHAQKGSIPESLCPHNGTLLPNPKEEVGSAPSVRKDAAVANGAHVTTGQFLGRIGNSGQSEQGPHLHVHMEKDNQPVVMKFAHGLTTSFAGGKASFDGPWKALAGNAMPKADILFWPPRGAGTWTFKGTPDHEFQALFQHLADSGNMPEWVSCQSGGDTYDSKWVPWKGVWNLHFGMNALEAQTKNLLYTGQGYKRTSSYTCGSISVAVWWKS
jgi:hypothetical protein